MRRIVVTGLGLVTAVGHTVDETWESIVAGRSGVSPIDIFDASGFSSRIGATIRNFDLSPYMSPKEARKTDQFIHYGIAAAWPHMVAAAYGKIVTIASMAAHQGGLAIGPEYSTSKGAVVTLTKCLALDGAKNQISVNCVCPGFVETPMAMTYFEAQEDPAASRAAVDAAHPLGRMGEPEEIANPVLFLASAEASFITGQALAVDGGVTSHTGLPNMLSIRES